MKVKYKVRVYLEVMHTIEIDGDIKTPVEEVAREAIRGVDLYALARQGGEYSEDIIAIKVDTYKDDNVFDVSDELDVDEVLFGKLLKKEEA